LANITMTEGVHIAGDAPAAEDLLARWGELSARGGEIVPNSGAAQGRHELHKAGFVAPHMIEV
jgi:hypothetical protein